MATINDPKLRELLKALNIVQDDLRRECLEQQELIGKTPLHGWTQEKHDQYHRQRKVEAEQASKWVFIRIMSIDPD